MSASKWKRVGWRSLRHLGFPRMVVRFGINGGKAKLLENDGVDYSQQTVAELVRDAEAYWATLKGDK